MTAMLFSLGLKTETGSSDVIDDVICQ